MTSDPMEHFSQMQDITINDFSFRRHLMDIREGYDIFPLGESFQGRDVIINNQPLVDTVIRWDRVGLTQYNVMITGRWTNSPDWIHGRVGVEIAAVKIERINESSFPDVRFRTSVESPPYQDITLHTTIEGRDTNGD